MERGQKRSAVQRKRDRATIAQMALKGRSQLEIADFLELSQGQVSRELKKIKAEWQAASTHDHALQRGRVLAKLELTEREFWEAWQASREQKESALVEQLAIATGNSGDGTGNTRTKNQKRTEDQHGNPAYLRGVLDAIKEQAKLLNLYPDSLSGDSHTPTGTGAGLSETAANAIRAQILGIPQNAQQ